MKNILYLLLVLLSSNSIGCISCTPDGPQVMVLPTGALYSLVNYNPSGLEISSTVDIDKEGKVSNIRIVSISDPAASKKIAAKIISQTKFKAAVDRDCISLDTLDYQFNFIL